MENIANDYCSQSSNKLVTTRLEVMLQILSAITLFRSQVTMLRSFVMLTTMKQDVVKSCTSCIVLYPVVLGTY